MSFDIRSWMKCYMDTVLNTFGDRVVFIGLQGSHGRGEAGEESDIDAVLILDRLDTDDLKTYRDAIASLPEQDKICGFVSGRPELALWERSDLFSFCYDTQPLYGSIDYLFPLFEKTDVGRCVLNGACAVYHACCHNFVFEKDNNILRALQKSAFFVLRAKHFYEKDVFVKRKSELLKCLSDEERAVLETDAEQFALLSEKLLTWAGGLIREFGADDLNPRGAAENFC